MGLVILLARLALRLLLVVAFSVVGWSVAIAYSLVTFAKVCLSPKQAMGKKKHSLPPPCYLDTNWGQHYSVQCNGIQLYYVAAGEVDKPLMLFLHGFPECWYSWRHQLRYFRHTHRVVAPDLRGYGRSSRPSMSVKDYHPHKIVEDVRALVRELNYEKCVLVGHDWGGSVAWLTAERYPEIVEQLVIMDCPQVDVFWSFLQRHPSQLLKSLYMLFFYAWPVPELTMCLFDYRLFKQLFLDKPHGVVNGTRMTSDDVETFVWSISRKGALTAALNYYRNLPSLLAPVSTAPDPKIRFRMPTLIMWGEGDAYLDSRLAIEHEKCGMHDDITVRVVPSCSHWLQQDQPEVVNQLVRAWLQVKTDKD